MPVGTSHKFQNHMVSEGRSTFCNGVEAQFALEAALDHMHSSLTTAIVASWYRVSISMKLQVKFSLCAILKCCYLEHGTCSYVRYTE